MSTAGERGLADAQFCVGCCYARGEGVERDWPTAAGWLDRAWAQGHAGKLADREEMFAVATCYARGLQVKQSWKEAVKWYKLAAEKVRAPPERRGIC